MVTALELLEDRADRKLSVLNRTFNPGAAALSGFGLACFLNFALRKPVWSGIQKHLGFSLLGAAIGVYVDKKRDQHIADRDAVFRHYIELHPEDFPEPERKKYADVLELWVPIR